MSETTRPFYQKLSFNLLSISVICVGLVYGRGIVLPLLFSILLATLLLPAINYFSRRRVPGVISILIPLALAIIGGGAILYFLSSQIINFTEDIPAIKNRIDELGTSLQKWVKATTHITIRNQNKYIKDTLDNLKDNAPQIAGQTVGSITEMITYMTLIPIYTFLILCNRSVIKTFLVKVFKNGSEENVTQILSQSTAISQQYIAGLMIETVLVFTLNAVGFLILGIKYAIFLAILGALLNLIPYVGLVIANILCMLITLISSDNISDVVWVGIILAIVQFIDNNIGMPLIVGHKVKLNGLVTILGILIGGSLCGVSGMFLAIPALAVSKVICDRVKDLQPWGQLLGDGSEDSTQKKKSKILKLIQPK